MRYYLIFIMLSFMAATELNGQCFKDRHSTTADASWISCDKSQSPNRDRPESHWIEYDLGEARKLGQVYFWNLNHPDFVNGGVKKIIIDYSIDGAIWTKWGEWEFEVGTGYSYYEGGQGPDLDGIVAEYILITVLENYGHECAGFSEIKIDVLELSSVDDQALTESAMTVQPNPAVDFTYLKFDAPKAESAVLNIISMDGKIVFENKLQLQVGEQLYKLDLPDVVAGQYLVKIESTSINISSELNITTLR